MRCKWISCQARGFDGEKLGCLGNRRTPRHSTALHHVHVGSQWTCFSRSVVTHLTRFWTPLGTRCGADHALLTSLLSCLVRQCGVDPMGKLPGKRACCLCCAYWHYSQNVRPSPFASASQLLLDLTPRCFWTQEGLRLIGATRSTLRSDGTRAPTCRDARCRS